MTLEVLRITPQKMTEPEDTQKPVRPIARDEFLADLKSLTPAELRRKYNLEANSHRNMKSRCLNGQWQVAEEWEDFKSFLTDVGPRPTKDHSLDRLDPSDPHYGPGKVRWADKKTQTVNRSNTRFVEHRERTYTLQEFAALYELDYKTVWSALDRGEAPEEIAKRALGRAGKEGAASPDGGWKHHDPTKEAALRKAFDEWKRRLKPNREKYAHIDVYYFLRIRELMNELYDKYRVYLERYDEAPEIDEYDREVQVWQDRKAYARDCISKRDAQLADHLFWMSDEVFRSTWRGMTYSDSEYRELQSVRSQR